MGYMRLMVRRRLQVSNSIMKSLARSLALGVALACVTACGPLSHTVKLSMVPEASRAEVEPLKVAADQAKSDHDAAVTAVRRSKEPVEVAEAALEMEENLLEVAEVEVDMARALEKTGEDTDVAAAKTSAKEAKQRVRVAKAALEVEEARRKHVIQLETETEAVWVLALATYEAAKAVRVTSDHAKWPKKREKVDAQLVAKTEALEKEQSRTAKTARRLKKAEDRLVDEQG